MSGEGRCGAATGRRGFLALSAGALLGSLPACAALASVSVPATGGRVVVVPGQHPSLDDAGGFLTVRPEGWRLPLYVLRREDGGFAALSPVCTHLGCVVEVQGPVLVCPCHGSTYDRTGAVIRGPAPRPLRSLPTTLEPDGTLVIDVRAGEP